MHAQPLWLVCYLFELPFDSGIPDGYVVHQKDDPTSPIEHCWEGFWGTEPLTEEQVDGAIRWSTAHDTPMWVAMRWMRDAERSLLQENVEHAVVETSTAIELAISDAVRLCAPLAGYSAEKVENVLGDAFAARVKDHFATLLGFADDPDAAADPLGDWWRNGYVLRSRIVHRGRRPRGSEPHRAVATTNAAGRDHRAHAQRRPLPRAVSFLGCPNAAPSQQRVMGTVGHYPRNDPREEGRDPHGHGWFRTTDLSRVKRLGVRVAERADRPPFRAILAFDARVARRRDAVGSGRIGLDSGSTAQRGSTHPRDRDQVFATRIRWATPMTNARVECGRATTRRPRRPPRPEPRRRWRSSPTPGRRQARLSLSPCLCRIG